MKINDMLERFQLYEILHKNLFLHISNKKIAFY